VDLDVPCRRVGEHSGEVVGRHVGIRIEGPAVGPCVDRCTHRLEIVAHHQERATGRYRVQQVVNRAAIGSAVNRCVLRRHEVECFAFERVECVRIGVMALDG